MNSEIMMTGIDGFGDSTMADLVELRKSLSIGYTLPVSGQFDPIRVESLETTLKLLTFQTQHLRLWNQIPKTDAFSTVEEYNLLVQYGDDANSFYASGVLPQVEDSTYQRANQLVKFMGVTRSVDHPATLIRTVPADIIAQETINGALFLLGKLNQALYNADSSVVPLEWNGLVPQVVNGGGNVVDLRGLPISKDDIENGVDSSVQNFGLPTKMFSNPRVFTDFSKTVYPLQRTGLGEGGIAGTPVKGYSTLAGDIGFEPDLFVKKGAAPATSLPSSSLAPSAPTLGSFVVNAPPQTGSLFGAADAGAYVYQVTAVNSFGESAPTAVSAGQTVAAGGSVSFVITDGGGANPATGYKLYRSTKGGATTLFTQKKIARAAISGVYQATTSYTDLNADLPGCFYAIMLDLNAEAVNFKQLSPMIKMPLAIIAPAIRWMQLIYGTPIVYAPKKHVVYKNIGQAS